MVPKDFSKRCSELFLISKAFGKQITNAFEDFVYRFEPFVNSDKLSRASRKINIGGYSAEDLVSQWLQSLLPRNQSPTLLLWFERQVKIFQTPTGGRLADLASQLIGQLTLRINRLENKLFSLTQRPKLSNSVLDGKDLLFIKPASEIFSEPGNE